MIGDRLDTDIAGGIEAGTDSLLVMTGVSSVDDVVAAGSDERPTWIAHDLTALRRPGLEASSDGTWWSCGPWRARVDGGRLVVEGEAKQTKDADAWWAAVAAAGWDHLDGAGSPADTGGVTEPGRPTASG
jgi:hypothetical protein